MKQTFIDNHFNQTDSHDWNIMWFNQASKPHVYNELNEYQKVNHFPNSFEITRKDKMSEVLQEVEDLNILPESFIIPE